MNNHWYIIVLLNKIVRRNILIIFIYREKYNLILNELKSNIYILKNNYNTFF